MSLMNYGFTKSKIARLDDEDSDAKREGTEKTEKNKVKTPSKSSSKSPLKSNNKAKKETGSSVLKSPGKKEHLTAMSKKLPSQKTPSIKSPKENKSTPFSTVITPKNSIQSPKSSLGNSISPKKAPTDVSLPYVRIKMIMKSCPDVEMVPHESLHVITKATELFIEHLATESWRSSSKSSGLDYDSLSAQVHSVDNLEFLKETIPKKITWEECQKLIAARKANASTELF